MTIDDISFCPWSSAVYLTDLFSSIVFVIFGQGCCQWEVQSSWNRDNGWFTMQMEVHNVYAVVLAVAFCNVQYPEYLMEESTRRM